MKIAVTSQNRKTITEHAGMCRKFWIYEVDEQTVKSKALLELPKEQSFHESHGDQPHPLDDIDMLISGGMGNGLSQRLRRKGITAVITAEADPDTAVAAYLEGRLAILLPQAVHHHEHQHAHEHGHDCGCSH
jgi:predicted Fe-Mo cluster-binding NifX family protein